MLDDLGQIYFLSFEEGDPWRAQGHFSSVLINILKKITYIVFYKKTYALKDYIKYSLICYVLAQHDVFVHAFGNKYTLQVV